MPHNYLDQSPSLLSIGGTVVSSMESCAMGLGFKSRNIFRSPNFLGISNIFVKVFVVVENCLYIF
jgi:hypothetical protein